MNFNHSLTLFLLALLITACQSTEKKPKSDDKKQKPPIEIGFEQKAVVTFKGDSAGIALANKMYTAIGGKDRWAKLQSYYVKAQHTQPEPGKPYTNQVWRDLNEVKFKIEQHSEGKHVMAVIKDGKGWRIEGDSVRQFEPAQLSGLIRSHKFNVYKVLKDLAVSPGFEFRKGENDRLEIYRGGSFFCGFELDKQDRPYLYITRTKEGEEGISEFTKWANDDGYIHSAGGGPLNGAFAYDTETWQPGYKEVENSFEVSFEVPGEK